MNIKQTLENALKYVETIAQTKLMPWLENFLSVVSHDVVTQILPIIETSGAQVAAELVSGQPIGAIGTFVAAVATQAAKNMEAAGVQVAAHDFAAAITAYTAGLTKTGGSTTAPQAQ